MDSGSQQTVTAYRLTSTGYASAWALTHYLAKNRQEQFTAYWKEIVQLGPFQGGYPVLQRGMVPQASGVVSQALWWGVSRPGGTVVSLLEQVTVR